MLPPQIRALKVRLGSLTELGREQRALLDELDRIEKLLESDQKLRRALGDDWYTRITSGPKDKCGCCGQKLPDSK
jgi:hypothetical protein